VEINVYKRGINKKIPMRREAIAISLLFAVINSALAVIGPVAYLTEMVDASYYPNGTLMGNVSIIGYVEVGVPNIEDVLQYLRVNLTGNMSRVNLVGNTTYQSVASSPNYDFERTRLFHNTSLSDSDTNYIVTDTSAAPVINATIVVTNFAGGEDLYSNDNIENWAGGPYTTDVNVLDFQINISNPSSWRSLGNTNVSIVFQKDYGPSGEDAVNITTSPTASTGIAYSVDTDTDGYNETIYWVGTFTPGMTLQIRFNGTMIEGTNMPNATLNANLNGLDSNTRGARFTHVNNTAVFSELTINGKFSRGPVLSGVDMTFAGNNWRVRGFFENVANSTVANKLTYNVSEWRLYEVNSTTGAPNMTAALSDASLTPFWHQILPGVRLYTRWDTHLGADKPYYTPYFNWQVVWNDTWYSYQGVINTSLQFKTMYLNDIYNEKIVTGLLLPYTENETITIEEKLIYVGSSNININRVEINSTIPHLLGNGSVGGLFRINTTMFNLTYTNLTGTYEIDKSSTTISLSYADPTMTSDGYVRLVISDISTTNLTQGNPIGMNLTVNDYIILKYDLLTNLTTEPNDNYTFMGNSTAWTATPNKEPHPNQTIVAAQKRLTAYKELIAFDPNNPTLVNVTIRIDVFDKSPGASGISGIKFVDYIPNGTSFNSSTPIFVQFYNMTANAWQSWTKGVQYNQTNLGWVNLSDGFPATAWEYTNSTNATGWTLYNNETLIFTYQLNLTDPRVYVLPSEIAGFDPDTGRDLSFTTYGVITIIVPEGLLEPVINEGELTLSKFVSVGKPAEWIKSFEVYNPNMRPLTATFKARVFPDTVKAYATYTDFEGNEQSEAISYVKENDTYYATWTSTIIPFETRSYYVKVLTPAVIAVDRQIDVIGKISDNVVKLSLDIDLKNLALEDYPSVRLYLPLRSEQILSAVDSLGNNLDYSGLTGVILITDFKGLEARSVRIEFQESYPIVIVTPDQEEYKDYANIKLDIRVINGGEVVDYPFLETEVYTPYYDTIYSNIMPIKGLGVVETKNYEEAFNMPFGAPTGMYLASVRFREDFNVISTGEASFKFTGEGGYTIIGTIILITAVLGVSYLSFKRYKSYKNMR